MKLFNTLVITSLFLVLVGCTKNPPGINQCATNLSYVTNATTIGDDAIKGAAKYLAKITLGSDEDVVHLKLDTGSSNLIINASNFSYGDDTITGQKAYVYDSGTNRSIAINAQDEIGLGCFDDIKAKFSLTAKDDSAENVLGLGFGDKERLPHEAQVPAFFGQLVKNTDANNLFSLALCGYKPTSHVLFGGVDQRMKGLVGKFVPIIERSAFVVPAETLRLMDSKKVIGKFDQYDPESKTGIKTYLDSGTAFLLLPPKMAQNFATVVSARAEELGFANSISPNFYRTARSVSTTTARFESEAQIRQFPRFEITFQGADGTTKALELSPRHYLKPMHPHDPLQRTFAVRESNDDTVLGQPFLENHYLVFDRKNNAVGFGNIDVACASAK